MRARLLPSALLIAMAAPGMAQVPAAAARAAPAATAPPGGAPAAPVVDETAQLRAQLAQFQTQLGTAYAEIRRLRGIEATATAAQAANATCTAKNVRLVRIGNAILAAYDKRYRRGHFGPLELGRTRFETEAQEYAGQIYDNKYDVPVQHQTAPPDGATRKNETKNQ